MFNVFISVPSEWTDYTRLKETCDYYLSKKIEQGESINIIIQDKDNLAEQYAIERGFNILFIPLDWKYGRKAFLVRDSQLLDMSNACILFYSTYGQNIIQERVSNLAIKKHVLSRSVFED
jgi:hypothetical protein